MEESRFELIESTVFPNMYFVSSRKRNSDWIVSNDENANDDDDEDVAPELEHKADSEFNISLPDGKGFTVFDKKDVVVAVASGTNDTSVEISSSKKPLLFPIKHNVKRLKVHSEDGKNTERSNLEAKNSEKSNLEAKNRKATILDELYQEPERKAEQSEGLRGEVKEGTSSNVSEAGIPGCSQSLHGDTVDADKTSGKKKSKIVTKKSSTFNIGLEFYKTKNDNSYVLHIPCLAVFTFCGKLRFTLITGKIEVFGYVVNIESKNKTIDVYSPRRFMQIGIKAVLPFSIPDYSDLEAALKNKAMLPEGELSNIMSSFSPDDTLVLVEKLPSDLSPILQNYFDEVDIFFEKRVHQDGSQIEKNLSALLNPKSKNFKVKTFTEGCEWKQIKIKKCNLVCGGKGVGKSTLLKYLVNRTLTTKERVLCIDLDPGQTEFTPPGFVSAVIVEKPLLGPGFTHITETKKMAYFGSTNVALDPLKYIKSVNYVLQRCKRDPSLADMPWFINTMGFNKDIGQDIMINIIKLFRPDVVVQINSSDKGKNYLICLTANIVEIQPVMPLIPVDDEVLYHDLIKTESSAKMRDMAVQSGFRPYQMRDLMTLSYFSPLLSFPYYNFNAVRPRWVQMSEVCLAINESLSPRCILKAFNGSLVGLCNLKGISCCEKLTFGSSNEVFCKIAIKPEIAPCFGLGLVRAIDIKKKIIYIMTHLSDLELAKVNCLNLGSISPPASVFLNQCFADEPTVYTDFYKAGNNQKLKRIFKYVPHFNHA